MIDTGHRSRSGRPHPDVCRHQAARPFLESFVSPEEVGMEQIECGHVERGRHDDLAAIALKFLGEVESGVTVVETRVDVGAGDIDQPRCIVRLSDGKDDPHRQSGEGPNSPEARARSWSVRSIAGVWHAGGRPPGGGLRNWQLAGGSNGQ